MDLTCPKCHGSMRSYERNGVHVDQCADCRGIFLDRGELERLIDAENAWHSGPPAPPSRDDQRDASHGAATATAGSSAGLGAMVNEVISQVRSSKSSSYGGSHGSSHGSGYQKKRKKESFLGDLFG